MSSEDIHSQESNKSDFLVSNSNMMTASNMISEFDSNAQAASNQSHLSKIIKLDFSNLSQQQQAIRNLNSTLNTSTGEIKKPLSKEQAGSSENKE